MIAIVVSLLPSLSCEESGRGDDLGSSAMTVTRQLCGGSGYRTFIDHRLIMSLALVCDGI